MTRLHICKLTNRHRFNGMHTYANYGTTPCKGSTKSCKNENHYTKEEFENKSAWVPHTQYKYRNNLLVEILKKTR